MSGVADTPLPLMGGAGGIAETSGDFKRLYGRNFTENRPETIH
jgi:hypothetical protein